MAEQQTFQIPIIAPADPTLEQQHFCHLVKTRAALALEYFDGQISQKVADESRHAEGVRHKLGQDYDWRNENFSVKEAIAVLEKDKDLYSAVAAHIYDPNALYHAMEAIANQQINELLFSTNNYPLAALRLDQFSRVLGNLLDALREEEMLAPEDKRFESLINGYVCSLNGYENLRDQVAQRTQGQYASLLEWVGESVQEKNPEADTLDEKETKKLFLRRYRAALKDYGLALDSKKTLPVAYFYLMDLAQQIAMRVAMNAHPHETDIAALKKYADPVLRQLVADMSPLHRNASSLAEITDVENYLNVQYSLAFKQPDDFPSIVHEAAKKAERSVMQALPRLQGENQKFQKKLHTRGESMLMEAGIVSYDLARLSGEASRGLEEIIEHLDTSRNINDIAIILQDYTDAAVNDTVCQMAHPANILALREFTVALGRNLVASLRQHNRQRDANSPAYEVREVARNFEALVKKCDMAYACHWDAARICLANTQGAYANIGQYALALEMMKLAKPYDQLTVEDKDRIAAIASDFLTEDNMLFGIPEAWASHPFMPLLRRMAFDSAKQSMVARKALDTSEFPMFPDSISPDSELEGEDRELALQAYGKQIDAQREATLARLGNAVAMFHFGPPDSYGILPQRPRNPQTHVPYMDAKTLTEVADYCLRAEGTWRSH